MNLKQMKAFHATISAGSVSLAANNLNITQPAVSKLLQNLEDEVGYKLFKRMNRQIIPTSEARYLFHEVDEALTQFDRLDILFKSGQTDKQNRVQIGSIPGPANFLIPEILGKFKEKDIDFSATLTTRSSKVICNKIANKTIDIGVIDVHSTSPNYDFTLFPLTCLCAIPSSDPLSKKEFLVPADLNGKPMIGLPKGHIYFDRINHIFKQANTTYNVKHEIYVHLPAISMVIAGLGYAFIDSINIWSYKKYFGENNVVFKPFKPIIQEDMAIITPINCTQSKVTTGIVEHLKSRIFDIEKSILSNLPNSFRF